jgi:nucleotide-binding universal stress UspA family protein
MTGSDRAVLIAIDGSEPSLRALRYAVELRRADPGLKLHLLNVQPALRSDVANWLPSQNIREHHLEEGEKALAAARAALDGEGIPHEIHISVGVPGEVIAAFAEKIGASQIVMSTRGLGRAGALILGSAAMDTLRHTTVPVTFIK